MMNRFRTTLTMTVAVAAIGALAVAAPSAASAKTKDTGLVVTQLPASVRITTGESFKPTLTTNVTTGYSWKASVPKKSTVTVSKGVYTAPTSGLMGAAGTTTWTISGKSTGKTVVTIVATAPDGTNSTTDANGNAQQLTVNVSKS